MAKEKIKQHANQSGGDVTEGGKTAIAPTSNKKPKYKLAELLAEITDENLHEEWNVGPPVGREVI